MAWFDRDSREPKWVWLLTISREHLGRKNYSYRLDWNRDIKFDEKKVFEKFLCEIDMNDLVTIDEPARPVVDPSTTIYGLRHSKVKSINLFCREEDITKLDTDEPVHFYCSTEIEVDDKEKFIEVIRHFVDN